MKHLSLKERSYLIIKEKILNGDFEPGSRIREDILAEEISISRTPVREAINLLSAEGFLNNIPRKGIFMIDPTKEEIIDMLEVRIVLECLAVEKFIDVMKNEDISALENILDEFKEALEKEDYKKCNKLDSAFHMTIAKTVGNKMLSKFLSEIDDFMQIARYIEKKADSKAKNEKTLQEHSKILNYIKERDKAAARQAIIENIWTMKKNLNIDK